MIETSLKTTVEQTKQSELKEVKINGENFFMIADCDKMRPFFMSLVSNANHWMFIASNGGVSAGRKNADYALFPYYTDDKLVELQPTTASTTRMQIKQNNTKLNWEPFAAKPSEKYKISRNLYKNTYGNKIIFEEINYSLQLTFQYQWNTSQQYGFVRKAKLINHSNQTQTIAILDGIQNIVPYGISPDLQNQYSNLADAYKKNELIADVGLGIFALSAIIVDRAEPSEALKATTVWSTALDAAHHLLSTKQLSAFKAGHSIASEYEVKGEKGAYLLHAHIELAAATAKEWMIVANVNQSQSSVEALCEKLKSNTAIATEIEADIALGTQKLIALTASADGLQKTADKLKDSRHFANSLFNIMRGGVFDDNYAIEKEDFAAYLQKANASVYQQHKADIAQLPEVFSLWQLKALKATSNDPDFIRLSTEYLPLKFSRRHGDPSRPWNRFSINTQNEIDGSKVLDYEGNWRDIFQNWEALAHAFPAFIEGMIFRFLNASTFDGYNPYRITKDGFDWETIEADDPWSYIGYWGDHQIIYLLKFLEFTEKHYPQQLAAYFDQAHFVYANVPYKIKSYEEIVAQPKDTIDFDFELSEELLTAKATAGADATLLRNAKGAIVRATFVEKILASVLAKLSNFIPQAGIWMNTQRPEWNDANNALVGNGVSMVTLYYLNRYCLFLQRLLNNKAHQTLSMASELASFYQAIKAVFKQHHHLLAQAISNEDKRTIVDALGQAASAYRNTIYTQSFAGTKSSVSIEDLSEFIKLSLDFIQHTIAANKRADGLYHAYNLVSFEDKALRIAHLSEMLEGQVAVLSAGVLNASEALAVLDSLQESALYRADQNSYMLYPNKELASFLDKNIIPKALFEQSILLSKLLQDDNKSIVEQDVKGNYRFNANFRNENDLKAALLVLDPAYQRLVQQEQSLLLGIYEQVFNHKAFTGRSGTFFAYEGLGSIYWHMVSKLLLATQECCMKAIADKAPSSIVAQLIEHYYRIHDGIGVHKSPVQYGAFPTDPYSHTPAHKGAQQPGMTGQVKEDVLARFGELGVFVQDASLHFMPYLLQEDAFLATANNFKYINTAGETKEIALAPKSIAFTYCQTPIVYTLAEAQKLEVLLKNGERLHFHELKLNRDLSEKLFNRTGDILQIQLNIHPQMLQ